MSLLSLRVVDQHFFRPVSLLPIRPFGLTARFACFGSIPNCPFQLRLFSLLLTTPRCEHNLAPPQTCAQSLDDPSATGDGIDYRPLPPLTITALSSLSDHQTVSRFCAHRRLACSPWQP